MSRNRSASAAATSSPALLSRGFASLRRRLSTSNPTSPIDNTSRVNTESSHVNRRPRVRLVPNIGISTRTFIFDVIDEELAPNTIYRIGRFSGRNSTPDRFSFKSKVVSRNHAELWAENGRIYLRDVGSSSGTFLNRHRLSGANQVSPPHEIKDGDLVQLGVDYQSGAESMYRAVRMRVEFNRPAMSSPFNRTAFKQLQNQSSGASPPLYAPNFALLDREPTKIQENTNDSKTTHDHTELPTHLSQSDIQECCICLYAIAPFQALFAAPCSHLFHFKCLRPILYQNYPGFCCPLCRSYFDLEASVSIEVDEVIDIMNQAKELQQQQTTSKQKIDTVLEESNVRPSSSNHSDLSILQEEQKNSFDLIKQFFSVSEGGRAESHNGETILSRTLVGSPMFGSNVSTDNHA